VRLLRRVVGIEQLAGRLARTERLATQAHSTLLRNAVQADLLDNLSATLDEARTIEHVRQAIARSPVIAAPVPHIVVEGLLPRAVYKLLLKAIPPVELFGDADPIKQNLRLPMHFGPASSVRVLAILDEVVSRRAILPAVPDKFAEPVQRRAMSLFGDTVPLDSTLFSLSSGRLMLRRPGYRLPPHRDPKRTLLTCLLYLASSADDAAYGTHLYRVENDGEAPFPQTYYPRHAGKSCQLVATVPYRPNCLLAFVNLPGGAHGAEIPVSAPAKLERYAFQFYVGPDADRLDALVGHLPPGRRAHWVREP
jgi:hypothetical protein